MSSIFDFPLEIITARIFPSLTATETWSFCRVSEAAYEIVQNVARKSQDDKNLEGRIVPIVLDGSIAAFLRQRVKMNILTNRPELLGCISIAREAVKADGGSPDDIKALIKHGQEACNLELVSAIVPFDFNTKHIQANGDYALGMALISALTKKKLEMARAILSHPNAADIQADGGSWGSLGTALVMAICSEDQPLIRSIFSHPNAGKIPVAGEWGLGKALISAIAGAQIESVKAILSHPNAVTIPVEGTLGLTAALERAKGQATGDGLDTYKENSQVIAQLIFSHLEKSLASGKKP